MPAWVRPYLTGVLTAVLIAGSTLLLARPRGDAIEVIIATPAPATITVAVSGEVARPGVYGLAPGSRVVDLLAQAGGPTEAADPATPSRALLLRDEMHVHVPRAASTATTEPALAPPAASPPPAAASLATVVLGAPAATAMAAPTAAASATPVPATPAPAAPAAPTEQSSPVATSVPEAPAGASEPTATVPPAPPTPAPTARPQPPPAPAGPININTATAAQLEALPGVGPVLAGRIVADRQRNGPFRSIDDLDRVPGIGAATLARLRPLVRV